MIGDIAAGRSLAPEIWVNATAKKSGEDGPKPTFSMYKMRV